MEYLYMVAACLVGSFFGAYFGSRKDKDTPLPVEKLFRSVKKVFTPETTTQEFDKVYASWLYHRPNEVE